MKEWLCKIFKIPMCGYCRSTNLSMSYSYSRGWNNDLRQAACGGKGYYCYDCNKVSWEEKLSDEQLNSTRVSYNKNSNTLIYKPWKNGKSIF